MHPLHARATVIDALQINNWNRTVVEESLAGGVSGVNVTVAVWEDPLETIRIISKWYEFVRANADIVTLATDVATLRAAKAAGKLAVLLGFQNTSSFGDDYRFVEVFHNLGVRIAQLTYNNQNAVGGSCYEPYDSGLTRFGENIIAEMNRVGMVIDLSHVGNQTCIDAAKTSAQPVAITHANPTWYFDGPRNKPQEVITEVTSRGGMIGTSMYPLVIGGAEASLKGFAAMIVKLCDMVGVEHVGLGSDCTRNWGTDFLHWLRDGRWRRAPEGDISWPEWPSWFNQAADFPRITEALLDAGLSEADVELVLGENWLRYFETVFAAGTTALHSPSVSPTT
ncbi:MAG: membrane dipeptidase [Bowdeniella nasicola]|nr:membrane dipeptidase [Bowdeniella nasicola]